MKKIFSTFLLMVAFVTFFSCGKDDDNNSPPSIVGTWIRTDYILNGNSIFDPEVCSHKVKLIFNANGSYTGITPQGMVGSACDETNIITGTYEIENDNLYLINVNGTFLRPNLSITSTTLTFRTGTSGSISIFERQP